MSLTLNGTSQYLSLASALIAADGGTFACWFKTSNTSSAQTLIGEANSASSNAIHSLGTSLSTLGKVGVQRRADAGGASAFAEPSASYSSGWELAVGVFSSSTSRAAYDGESKGTSATSEGTTTLNRTAIGALLRSSVSIFFSGQIAHAAIWNTALSDADVADLAAGTLPSLIKPGNLVAYLPLTSNFTDTKGNSWTNNGSATINSSDNPIMNAGLFSSGAYIGGNPNGLQCPGIGANYASIQSSAANSISGDFQIDLYLALPDWTPSSQQYVASLWPITGNPAWFVAVATSGALAFTWEESGGTRHDTTSTAATGFTDGQPYWIRITLAVSNGAVKYYTSSDGVTFAQLGSTVTLGAATSLRTSIGSVAIGAEPHEGVWASGSYYRAKIYSGIGGTLAMDANFSEATPAAQTFAESSSNEATVTIHSTDSTSFGFYFTGSAGGAWETASNWSVNATPTTTGSVFVETNAPANPIAAATVGVLQWDIDSDIALSRLSIGSELDAQGSITNADLASIESVGAVVSLENLTLENHAGSFAFSDINGLATLRLNGGTGQAHIDAEGVAVSVGAAFAGTLYNDQYDADGYVQDLSGSNVSKATLVPGPQAFSDFVINGSSSLRRLPRRAPLARLR